MKIKVKGSLPDHVTDLGVRTGQEYDAEPAIGTRLDAVMIKVPGVDCDFKWCTLLPKNYQKL